MPVQFCNAKLFCPKCNSNNLDLIPNLLKVQQLICMDCGEYCNQLLHPGISHIAKESYANLPSLKEFESYGASNNDRR